MHPRWSDRFEAHLEACVLAGPTPSAVADFLAYHFGYGTFGPARRGKRLRPSMLLHVATQAGASLDDALDAAVAIEMVHNYSLIHDDIEDRDEMRHGKPTLWHRIGIAQAINAGDALCAQSFLALARAQQRIDPASVVKMIVTLHEAHRTMCEGQALDLAFEEAAQVNLDAYERMIAGKTAALFACACELGARCARLDEARVRGFREAGYRYGMAFQIRDDILGVWASADATGKVVGTDLARRKWSFPVVWALSQDASADRDVIERLYAQGRPLAWPEVLAVIEALDCLGAREAAQQALGEHLRAVDQAATGDLGTFLADSLALTLL